MITLTETDHRQLDRAIPDMIDLVNDTALTLGLLSDGFETGGIDPDQPAIASTLRLLGRTLRAAEEIEVPALMQVDRRVRAAVSPRREAERQAALQMGDAA